MSPLAARRTPTALRGEGALAPPPERVPLSDDYFLTLCFAWGAAGSGPPLGPLPSCTAREVVCRSRSMDTFTLH